MQGPYFYFNSPQGIRESLMFHRNPGFRFKPNATTRLLVVAFDASLRRSLAVEAMFFLLNPNANAGAVCSIRPGPSVEP
jgi:hypothetical protein